MGDIVEKHQDYEFGIGRTQVLRLVWSGIDNPNESVYMGRGGSRTNWGKHLMILPFNGEPFFTINLTCAAVVMTERRHHEGAFSPLSREEV
jgi:hypothetical protein